MLSLTPVNKELTYADVAGLSVTLKDWYFVECGGLYLSGHAQRAYREAQQALTDVAARAPSERVWREPGDDYERLRRPSRACGRRSPRISRAGSRRRHWTVPVTMRRVEARPLAGR